jgi:imidazolonepropionase-like amidohydrolase
LIDATPLLRLQGLRAVALARKAGIKMCYGSDLLGDLHPHQAQEFKLRATVQPAPELLQAATVNCAELFQMEHQLGQVAEGFCADLIVVKGDPLADVEVLCDEQAVRVVVKGGVIAKAPAALGDAVNAALCSA